MTNMGQIKLVNNRERKWNENKKYYRIKATINHEEVFLLFTERELEAGLRRSKNNPEDCQNDSKGWLKQLFGW